jgi:hypothetical protein
MHVCGLHRDPIGGPLEVVAIELPGARFKPEVLQSLTTAIDSGAVRVVDLTFLRKDAAGTVTSFELAELDECDAALFDLVDETLGLLSVVDLGKIGALLAPDSSAALLVLEHPWAADLDRAVLGASGRVVVRECIPADVARAAVADARATAES